MCLESKEGSYQSAQGRRRVHGRTRRSMCETGSFRRSSSSLFAITSSSSKDGPPTPIMSAKNEYLSSFTFSSSDQSESFWDVDQLHVQGKGKRPALTLSSDAASTGAVRAAMVAASPFVCKSCNRSLSALTGNATLVN
jgi:hypothetical protein